MYRSPYDLSARARRDRMTPLEKEAESRRIGDKKERDRTEALAVVVRGLQERISDLETQKNLTLASIEVLQHENLQLRSAIKALADIVLPSRGLTTFEFVRRNLSGFTRKSKAVEGVVVAAEFGVAGPALARARAEKEELIRSFHQAGKPMGLIQFAESILQLTLTEEQKKLLASYAVKRKPACGKCQDVNCVTCYPQGAFPG